jgi:uncharacterized protein (TIGR00266 family)
MSHFFGNQSTNQQLQSDQIDYVIHGEEMQCVELELDPHESIIAEAGSFMMMTDHIVMRTIFGDGQSANQGFMGKLMGAGKRLLTGESLFMTVYTNNGYKKEQVYLAAPYPGKIIPIDLNALGYKFICQKDAFLGAAKGVSVGIEFQKKLGVGLFGGEGFIMQKLEGDGMAFLHAGGYVHSMELVPGQKLRIDTGCIVGFTQNVHYDIEFVGGVKNTLFGGEGVFFATVEVSQGTGYVLVQSLPFSRLSERILSAHPRVGNSSSDEGSVLGGFGRLFED